MNLKILILSVLLFNVSAKAQHTVGSGGDYIRQTFEEARTLAAAKVQSIQSCSFSQMKILPSVKEWILTHKELLKKDIETSQHLWVVDDQVTCAFTLHSPSAPIYLSFPRCGAGVTNSNEALFLLVHESAHHLGVTDEVQADLIAKAVTDAAMIEKCDPSQGTPFDSAICQGPQANRFDIGRLMSPGSVKSSFGHYTLYARARLCSILSGCGDWTNIHLMTGDRYHYGNSGIFSVDRGQVLTKAYSPTVEAISVEPYYKIDFCPSDYFYCETNLISYSSKELKVTVMANTRISQNDGLFVPNLIDRRAINASQKSEFYFTAQGKVTPHCSWFQYSEVLNRGEGLSQEVEYVIYGTH